VTCWHLQPHRAGPNPGSTHRTRKLGTSTQPPAGTSYWPPVGTFHGRDSVSACPVLARRCGSAAGSEDHQTLKPGIPPGPERRSSELALLPSTVHGGAFWSADEITAKGNRASRVNDGSETRPDGRATTEETRRSSRGGHRIESARVARPSADAMLRVTYAEHNDCAGPNRSTAQGPPRTCARNRTWPKGGWAGSSSIPTSLRNSSCRSRT
jgi:hypothetical protein